MTTALTDSKASIDTMPSVAGRCPACRGASLFLGAGGHVTCSRLGCPDPTAADDLLHGERPDAYRKLLARLEADRARMLAASEAATVDEVRIAQSALASGYLHATAWAIQLFDGTEARETYLRDHADGMHLTAHDGPTITEAAADDRRRDLEKGGE